MMKTIFAALFVMAAVGCSSSNGGSTATGNGAACTARNGSYSVTYAPQAAGCPAIAEGITTADAPLTHGEGDVTLVGGATNTGEQSADGCTVTFDVLDPDGSSSRGSVTWNTAGSSGTGTDELVSANGASCIYTITLKQQ